MRRWDFGAIPDEVVVRTAGVQLRMYPAVEDTGPAVRLCLFPDRTLAELATRDGIVRLASLAMPQQHDCVRRACADDRELAMLAASGGMGRQLFDDIADRAVAQALYTGGEERPGSATEFEARLEVARPRVVECGSGVARIVLAVLRTLKDVRAALAGTNASAFAAQDDGMRQQVESLLPDGWARRTPEPWFRQLPKYLRAVTRRLERQRENVERDRRLQAQVEPFLVALRDLQRDRHAGPRQAEIERLRWMIEEFRVSLFAQELRTLQPVSTRRLEEQLRRARQ